MRAPVLEMGSHRTVAVDSKSGDSAVGRRKPEDRVDSGVVAVVAVGAVWLYCQTATKLRIHGIVDRD